MRYRSMVVGVDRRRFLQGLGTCTAVAGGVVLGVPPAYGREKQGPEPTPTPQPEVVTNLADYMKVPKAPGAIPGPFPGRVVQVTDQRAIAGETIDAKVVREMFAEGMRRLTGKDLKQSFALLLKSTDVVGLKVNPVGPPLINTKLELLDALIAWMVDNGLPKQNIVIWDRFDDMLAEGGYTKDRFPGVRIEALQTMGNEKVSWKDEKGHHVSEGKFDPEASYFAKGVVGTGLVGYDGKVDDEQYLNQHVFNGERSYFGKLVTKTLTKIVNLPVVKNTGNGISVATKNLGYGAVCNTGRLHTPVFFRVCTEVVAAPWIRDKLVLNVADGLRAQYDGGPMMNAQFVYPHNSLYFATDPFALDMVCHRTLLAKRKEMNVAVNEHPRFTEYLYQAERLGLGVANPDKIEHLKVQLPVATT